MPLRNVRAGYNNLEDPEFSSYYLSKWSRMVRIRDKCTCQLCLNVFPSIELQAHHIFPKHKYPNLAYMLWNGISLCADCHLRVVHSDMVNESRFRMLFWNSMQNNDIIEFNQNYQERLVLDYRVDHTVHMKTKTWDVFI